MRCLLFCLISLPVQLSAQDQRSAAIDFLETGVICAPDVVGTSVAPNTVAGVTNIIEDDPPFVTTTNRVPAVLGVGFGAKVSSLDDMGIEGVSIIVRHPAMGQDGATVQSYDAGISGFTYSNALYQFDFDYELLPGRWSIEGRKDGQLLFRSQFDVVPPQEIPELAGVCGFQELLS